MMEMLSTTYFCRVEQNLKQNQVLQNMEYQKKLLTHYACDHWLKRFYDITIQNAESNEQENIFF